MPIALHAEADSCDYREKGFMTDQTVLFQRNLQENQVPIFAKALWPVLKRGDMIALHGDLGSGKSTLARALVRTALNDPDLDVPSPTFTLVQSYSVLTGPDILHTDLYRLQDTAEVAELGLDEARADSVLLVEWPDRLPAYLLEDALILHFEILSPGVRRINFMGSKAWSDRLEKVLDVTG